ncbi:MAG: TetR/AcrR family transcriptional regulator [Clostridia bacterium]|nr:TetR/AcrR family transcriptional regulator [Clostridia bacterium]
MPPKVRITKSDIIKTALELLRENGETAINARKIAEELNCSTQPIFSNFSTMEELQGAVVAEAYKHYLDFLQREVESGKYPKYKAFGMAYIRFAKEERELFKLLFMRDRTEEDMSMSPDFEESVQMIMKANGVTIETARLMHLEMWTCVHGIGTMLATSFLSLEWELISDMLTDVYQGIRARHLSEEKQNECNKN